MPKFEKDVLYVGQWRLPDGRRFDCTPDVMTHLGTRLSDMLAAGVPVALSKEHVDGAIPDTPEKWDALRAGKCDLAWGHAWKADLQHGGPLKVVVDVPNPDTAKQLPAVRFVSPDIRKDWTDGRGRTWPGLSIVSLAATPRPVQYPQQPFKPISLAEPVAPIRLSMDGYDGQHEEEKTGDNGADKKTPRTKVPDRGDLGSLLTALAEPPIGLVLPGDTTPENLVERLFTACLTKKAAHEQGKDEEEEPDYPGTQRPQAEQQPMTMSSEDTDRAKRTEARLLKLEKATLRGRIKALFDSGRVGKPIQDSLYADLEKAPLQLSEEGELRPDPVVYRIEAYEALPEGCAWPVQMGEGGRAVPVPPPDGHFGPRDAKSVIADIDLMMGRPAAN